MQKAKITRENTKDTHIKNNCLTKIINTRRKKHLRNNYNTNSVPLGTHH